MAFDILTFYHIGWGPPRARTTAAAGARNLATLGRARHSPSPLRSGAGRANARRLADGVTDRADDRPQSPQGPLVRTPTTALRRVASGAFATARRGAARGHVRPKM